MVPALVAINRFLVSGTNLDQIVKARIEAKSIPWRAEHCDAAHYRENYAAGSESD